MSQLHYIHGHWQAGEGDDRETSCPTDPQLKVAFREAAPHQIDEAFRAARQAFGPWWDLGQAARIALAQQFAQQVEARQDELVQLICEETGKPRWEAKTEAAAVVGKVGVSIEALHQRRDTTSFEMGSARAVTRFKPHGVCAVLGPFNFPAHLPNGHVVPALIAGNTVVFKPSEQTPQVGAWLARQWEAAGLPPGVLNVVQGGVSVGMALSRHPELDGLFFTGSSRAGTALSRTLAPTPQKILALEMGGNNPLIVDEVRDLSAAAYLTVLSAYLTAGQRCTCARRLILPEGAFAERFLERLKAQIGQLRVGPYTDQPEPFLGPVISAEMGQRLLAAQQDLQARGAETLVEMESRHGHPALLSPGLLDVTAVPDRPDEEHFGPLLSVIRVPDFDAAIEEANRTQYGLAAGLLSDREDRYRQFIHQIRAGVVNWNRQTTGASGKLPFGGCGLSGNHRPSAYFAADYCSFPVASLEAPTLEPPETLLPGIESVPSA